MRKNVASQYISAVLINKTDGSPVTSGTTNVFISKDGAAQAAGGNTTATHKGNGEWEYACTQADTNANHLVFTFVNSSAINAVINVEATAADPADAVRLGLSALPNAAAEAAGGLFTRGTGAGQINQPANGRIDANIVALANDVITAASIQAAALTAAKFGTGAITHSVLADGAISIQKLATDLRTEIERIVEIWNIANNIKFKTETIYQSGALSDFASAGGYDYHTYTADNLYKFFGVKAGDTLQIDVNGMGYAPFYIDAVSADFSAVSIRTATGFGNHNGELAVSYGTGQGQKVEVNVVAQENIDFGALQKASLDAAEPTVELSAAALAAVQVQATAALNAYDSANGVARQSSVDSIQNNTNFVASIPEYMLIPGSSFNVYKVRVNIYDEAGQMEDPDSNDLGLKLEVAIGATDKNALLFKDDACTTALDSSGISGHKKLERADAGVYFCYIKVASTESVAQFMYGFAFDENALRRYFSRTNLVLTEEPGTTTLADNTTNADIVAKALKTRDVSATPAVTGSIEDDLLDRFDDVDAAQATADGKLDTALLGISDANSSLATIDGKIDNVLTLDQAIFESIIPNYYVAVGGSSGNDGKTWATAKDTIANGLALLTTKKGILHVGENTWQEDITIPEGVTVRGYGDCYIRGLASGSTQATVVMSDNSTLERCVTGKQSLASGDTYVVKMAKGCRLIHAGHAAFGFNEIGLTSYVYVENGFVDIIDCFLSGNAGAPTPITVIAGILANSHIRHNVLQTAAADVISITGSTTGDLDFIDITDNSFMGGAGYYCVRLATGSLSPGRLTISNNRWRGLSGFWTGGNNVVAAENVHSEERDAVEIWVDKSITTSGNGLSQATAFKTIAEATAYFTANKNKGTIFLVSNDVDYQENVSLPAGVTLQGVCSGSSTRAKIAGTFVSEATPIITMGSTSRIKNIRLHKLFADHITNVIAFSSGCEIEDCSFGGAAVLGSFDRWVMMDYVYHGRIHHNLFEGIYETTQFCNNAIYADDCLGVFIENNLFWKFKEDALDFTDAGVNGLVIRNNSFIEIATGKAGIKVEANSGHHISGNTGNGPGVIVLETGAGTGFANDIVENGDNTTDLRQFFTNKQELIFEDPDWYFVVWNEAETAYLLKHKVEKYGGGGIEGSIIGSLTPSIRHKNEA